MKKLVEEQQKILDKAKQSGKQPELDAAEKDAAATLHENGYEEDKFDDPERSAMNLTALGKVYTETELSQGLDKLMVNGYLEPMVDFLRSVSFNKMECIKNETAAEAKGRTAGLSLDEGEMLKQFSMSSLNQYTKFQTCEKAGPETLLRKGQGRRDSFS